MSRYSMIKISRLNFFPKLFISQLLATIQLTAQNNALDFDGSNDYVSISSSSSLQISNNITLEAWIKLDNTSGSKVVVLSADGGAAANTSFILRIPSAGNVFRFSCGGGSGTDFDGEGSVSETVDSPTISSGIWYHVAGVRNGTSLTLYLNGKSVATESISNNSLHTHSSSLGIGYFPSYAQYFDGQIDEVRIWNDARSQAEIKANMYKELSGSESNLVAYYNFNDGSGTTLTDLTSNSNDGTMNNMDGSSDWVSNTLYGQDKALDFDGSNDYVVISENSAHKPSSALTLSAWIYIDDWTNTDYFTPISITQNGGYSFYLHTDDKLYFYVDAGGSYIYPSKDVSAVSSGWHQVTGTFDGRYAKLYWDGALAETIDNGSSVSINYGTANLIFGAEPSSSGISSGYYFDGKLDEVRIWDDVRTQSEIQDNMYTELVGNENNLVAYYNFNGGRGNSLVDITTNNNMGTLTNMAPSTDWTSTRILGASISGNSGFRMLSSPVSGQILGSLLTNLWTQGMTGSDAPEASSANVWTLNVSGQSWTTLSDISTSGTSLSAGQGFLVYVYEDTDNDGSADLPATISVSGTENSGNATISSVPANGWVLAGNPYSSTIDWDLISDDNSPFGNTAYVWDDASSAYKSWNGSGSLTDGLIAPYQAFWVQNTFVPNQTLTISEDHKASRAGTLYRSSEIQRSGSMSFNIVSETLFDETYVSFQEGGNVHIDESDGYKLVPLNYSDRITLVSYASTLGLDINNLPFEYEGTISIPLDVMSLSLEDNTYITGTAEVSMSWNLDNLPEHIDLTLVDNLTGEMVYLNNEMSHTFTTEPKGSFSATYEEAVGIYPLLGDARFSVQISYGVLDNAPIKVIPKDYALSPVYPNPFNPSATVRFDVPEVSRVELQVYDVTGKLVETLLNEMMTAGQHQYTWQPEELATGTYFLRLITANQTFTQKVTYVK